jgi:cytochrome c553
MQDELSSSVKIAIGLTAIALPIADAAADPRAGERKAQLCLLCHRVESSVGAPTLEQQPSKYLVAQINAFKSGQRVEPSMQSNVANLSARDVQDISEYFSVQRARRARFATEPDPNAIATGSATAKELNCASCHADDYRGGKDAPRLAGQVSNYLVRQITEIKRGTRAHPVVPKIAEKLTDARIEALGAYFGKLEP